MIDEKTSNYNISLPFKDNQLKIDVERLRSALNSIDNLLKTIESAANLPPFETKAMTALGAIGGATSPLGHRNLLVNGDFRVWQRGTSDLAVTSQSYHADRWKSGGNVTSSQMAISDQAVPATKALKLKANSSSDMFARQLIESLNVSSIPYSASLTFSAYVFSSKERLLRLRLLSAGSSDDFSSPINEQYVDVNVPANTWTKVSGGFNQLASGKNGLLVEIKASQPAVNDVMAITCAQLEVSPTDTAFEIRPYAYELSLCMRYYEVMSGTTTPSVPAYTHHRYKVMKRAMPTLSYLFGSGGGANISTGIAPTETFRLPENIVATTNADWGIAADAELQ